MEEFDKPEIQRIDLAATILSLRAFGVGDPAGFRWFEPPRAENLSRAERLLEMLGAIDPKSGITPLGRKLAMLPLHPRIGRLLLAGAEQGLLREAATLAALLSEKDILAGTQPTRGIPARFKPEPRLSGPSDMLLRYDLLTDDHKSSLLDPQSVRQVERVRDELIELMGRENHPYNKSRKRRG